MSGDEEDVDARFRALISADFPDEAPLDSAPVDPHRPGRPAAHPEDDENPISLFAAWDKVDAIDEGPYRPEHLDLGGRWPLVVIVSAIACGAGLVLGLAQLADLVRSPTLATLSGALFFGGLAGLMVQAFRRKGSPPDEEGS